MRIMSTTKNTPEVQRVSQPAQLFIGLMGLSGAVVVGWVALTVRTWPHLPFLAMLAIAVPASRLKLKLPGLNGNMSVNLPFILLAAVTLSALAIAVGLASGILHGGVHVLSVWASASRLLMLAGTSLLLAQTVPVATI